MPLALVSIRLPALPLLRLRCRFTLGPSLATHNLTENSPGLPHDGLRPLDSLVTGLAVVG